MSSGVAGANQSRLLPVQIDADNYQKQEPSQDNGMPALHSLQSAKSIQNMQLDCCLFV